MPPRRHAPVVAIIAIATALAFTAGASAATEIGSRCLTVSGTSATFIQTVDPVTGPGYGVPSAGVITKWGTNLPAVPALPMRLKLVRPAAAPNTWTVVAASDASNATTGMNEFSTRLPVTGGERLAMYSSTAAVYCASTDPAELIVRESPAIDTGVGATVTPTSTFAAKLAMYAVIEPDGDLDGYGDETQDLCPQSALHHAACPIVKVASVLLPGASSLQALVAVNTTAPVSISVSASVPSGRKSASAKTIRLKSITKTVLPGVLAQFKLKYTSKLLAALKQLPRSKKVKLKVTIRGTGIINVESKTRTVTLRGRR